MLGLVEGPSLGPVEGVSLGRSVGVSLGLAEGTVEIRCRQTLSEIEEQYGEQYGGEMMNLLEMKSDDAPWDDYRALIDLVE